MYAIYSISIHILVDLLYSGAPSGGRLVKGPATLQELAARGDTVQQAIEHGEADHTEVARWIYDILYMYKI